MVSYLYKLFVGICNCTNFIKGTYNLKQINKMAKSNGILKIEGTLDELTFYNKDGKSFVRKKGGVSKERIENDPNYVRTRENNAEFSHSTSSAKTLRMALGRDRKSTRLNSSHSTLSRMPSSA